MSEALNEPRLRHVECLDARGLHRMAYWQWERNDGASDRVLVCVHGLSRQGRDFDTLARAMQDGWRVVCPDVVGRGESDRLADPAAYSLPTYVADMVTLLARLDAKTVHWFGTSMGGLIGIALAALPGSPISRLVLNDVGPAIDRPESPASPRTSACRSPGRARTKRPTTCSRSRTASAPHSRDQWLALTRPMLRKDGDRIRLHYDPAIGVPLRAMTPAAASAGEAALWAAYDRIALPDARRARRRLRCPRADNGGGDGRARTESARARVRRRRSRADDRRCRPGRRRAGVPARSRVVVASAAA